MGMCKHTADIGLFSLFAWPGTVGAVQTHGRDVAVKLLSFIVIRDAPDASAASWGDTHLWAEVRALLRQTQTFTLISVLNFNKHP